jgi:hypothetical protein
MCITQIPTQQQKQEEGAAEGPLVDGKEHQHHLDSWQYEDNWWTKTFLLLDEPNFR